MRSIQNLQLIYLAVLTEIDKVAFWQLFQLNEYEWINEWMNEWMTKLYSHLAYENNGRSEKGERKQLERIPIPLQVVTIAVGQAEAAYTEWVFRVPNHCLLWVSCIFSTRLYT